MNRDEHTAVVAYVAIIALVVGLIFGLLLAQAWGDVYVAPGTEYTIQWTPGEGVTPSDYDVQKLGTDGQWVSLCTVSDTSTTDTCDAGASTTYRVRACVQILGGDRICSEYSNESENVSGVVSVPKPCGVIVTIGGQR